MTHEVTFTCKGCGARVRTFRFINYRTIPPTVDESDLCASCKERGAAMTIDRTKLEEAIGMVRAGPQFSHQDLITLSQTQANTLAAAAEAHLASLPKPQWRVRLHRGNTFELYTYETSLAALSQVSWATTRGYDKVEIEAPTETAPVGERVCAWAEVRDGQVLGFHTIKMRPVKGAEMVELVGYTKAISA